MKFVIAPDKFKGSLTGFQFCNAVEEGITRVFRDAEILKLPLADGGDGTMEVVQHYLHAEIISKEVNDPLFRPVSASYAYSPDSKIAYIEMAEASGLRLLTDDEKNCMETTSRGTGELIADALEKGAGEILLGIGGSATNDGGLGMAQALGYRFFDKEHRVLAPIGRNLIDLHHIDREKVHPALEAVRIRVACDVKNPLYGKNGAAWVYAAQKGASEQDIEVLDQGLRNFAKVLNKEFGAEVQQIPGSGAAGGIGAGALVFLNASLTPGIVLIQEIAKFDRAIEGADWIITGEGKLDDQTLSGKTIHGVLQAAHIKGIPVAAFCGTVQLSKKSAEKLGLNYAVSVSRHMPDLETAIKAAYDNVVAAAYEFAKKLR